MKTGLTIAAVLLLVETPAIAHRLDEYLQGIMISVEQSRVQAQIRLTPGVAVVSAVLADIDTDSDGILSGSEQDAYARRVLRDLSATIDGDSLRLQLLSMQFPTTEAMKDGSGEIQISFSADLPPGGPNRRLILKNDHQPRIAAYQVNSLVPRDPNIRIEAQKRNYSQSLYEVDYVQAGVPSGWLSSAWRFSDRGWLGLAVLLLLGRFAWLWRRRRAHNQRRGSLDRLPDSVFR